MAVASTPRKNTLVSKVGQRMARSRTGVFLPKDFEDLGGYDQVLRALRTLRNEGKLVRLGYGIYARAKVSSISKRVMIDNPGGFVAASRIALNKLNVPWEPTQAELDYNQGKSTQIPMNPAVAIRGRFSRQLSFGANKLTYAR